jgi:hypothetical protein
MDPPREQFFESREQLLTFVRQHAIQHSYIVTIQRSTANRQVILGCDRGGKYRDRNSASDREKRRFTTTRRINCPFRLYGKRILDGRWELKVSCSNHNHDPDNLIGHPQARQLTSAQLHDLRRLTEVGTRPRDIMTLLREQEPSIPLISRDIYNKRQAVRREKLGGKTSLQYLHDLLVRDDWKYSFKQDREGRILFFMFAHQESIKFANRYNRVFVLDCTYKTNRYRMPLFHIVGVSPSNATFSIAFCFMHNEQVESYIWALRTFFSFLDPFPHHPVLCSDRDLALVSAIESVCPWSPHLICIWHINKNVAAKAKTTFTQAEEFDEFFGQWMKLIHAPTEDEYNQRLYTLESKFLQYPVVIRYLKDTWLVHKEKFVIAWTRQHLHLGNGATSRVEGSHSFIKKHIGSSSGDMLIVFEQVKHGIKTQIDILKLDIARDRLENPLTTSQSIYSKITTRVTRHAIKLIGQQLYKAKMATERSPLPKCTNVWAVTMGLPCAHRLKILLQHDASIELREIHSFWYTDVESIPIYTPLLEPRLPNPISGYRKRLSPFSERGKVEKRILSTFEDSTENAIREKRTIKCSNCGVIGHNRRICTKLSNI